MACTTTSSSRAPWAGDLAESAHVAATGQERTVFVEEVTESCRLLTEDGDIEVFSREDLKFGYDYSILHEHKHTVLDVVFSLKSSPASSYAT